MILVACSSTPESSGETEGINLVEQEPDNCLSLGNIQQVQQSFFTNSGDNIRLEAGTRELLKNRALGKGGDTLYILPDRSGRLQRSRQYGTAARQYTKTFVAAVFDCRRPSSTQNSSN